ncbi:hypothetical protein EYS14_23770 [Alteromonadaceae bacterium M269]|nr:hypothetical protein EYS14_23770 [Alteromonadaceae bacterium M269]
MHSDTSERLLQYLKTSAVNRTEIPYAEIYKFFVPNPGSGAVWDTFEEVCNRLAEPKDAIYGALLAKADTSLPGEGFFDIYKNVRRASYLEVTYGESLQANQLSLEQKKMITQMERERVHQHAVSTREKSIHIFDANDELAEILSEVRRRGIAGISGGRIETREKIRALRDFADSSGFDSLESSSTYNHPDTELAFPYDSTKYTRAYALKLVLVAYEKANDIPQGSQVIG